MRGDDGVLQGRGGDGVGLQAAVLSEAGVGADDLRHSRASGIHRILDLHLLVIPAQAGIHTPRPPAKPRMNGSLPCGGAACCAMRRTYRVQSAPAASRANHCATRARVAAGSAAWWLNSLVFGEYA